MIHSEGISVSSEIKQNWWGGWSCCDLFASWLGACCMWRLVFFLSHLMLWRNAAVHFALNYKSGTYAFFWFVTWCLSCKPLHGHVMVYNAIKVPTITFVICNHRIQLWWIGYMVSDTFITWNYVDVGSICTYPTMTMRTGSTLCFTPPALK